MLSTSLPACLTSAASRLPGSWLRTSDSARTSLRPMQSRCPNRLLSPSDAEQEDIAYCIESSTTTETLLIRWRTEFIPLSADEPLDDRFVEALHMLAFVDVLIDCVTFGPASKKADAAKRLLDGQLLPMVESRLNTLDRKEAA